MQVALNEGGHNPFRRRIISAEVPGVYVLPQMLTEAQIREITGLESLRCCGPGGDDEGHGGALEEDYEEEEKEKEEDKKKTSHGFRAEKPLQLPGVARLIFAHIPEISIRGLRACSVDENMRLYRLQEGSGVVSPHVDEDFEGPSGSVALCSILVYLNDTYLGGETLFNGVTSVPGVVTGGGLLFRHDILHEGLMVLSGEKYVLKTDLLFR